jgi:hypothetical protein
MRNTSTGLIYISTAEAMNSQIAPPPAAEGRVGQGFPNSQALSPKPQRKNQPPHQKRKTPRKHTDGITQYATALGSHFYGNLKSQPHNCNRKIIKCQLITFPLVIYYLQHRYSLRSQYFSIYHNKICMNAPLTEFRLLHFGWVGLIQPANLMMGWWTKAAFAKPRPGQDLHLRRQFGKSMAS